MKARILRSLPILAAIALAAPAVAQSTAFTYQGRLRNGSPLASGLHDFQFRLFDAASGGNQVGSTQCVDNVPVAEGIFATTIDFGQQYATPSPRFLEVQVRADAGLDCSNTSGFAALPRQLLTSTPLAIHASSAFALDAPDGSHPHAVFVDNAGRIGVGTTLPQAPIHLVTGGDGVRVQGPSVGAPNAAWIDFRDSLGAAIGFVGDGSVGDASIYLASNTGDVFLYTGSGFVLTATRLGAVGIGISSPSAKLEVRGDIALGPSGQFRAAAGVENLRIIRGVVCGNTNNGCQPGTIVAGAGFQASTPATGQINITFSTPFSATPAVTATVQGLGSDFFSECFAMTQSATPSGVNLQVLLRDSGDFAPRTIHFIAVGPR